MAEASWPSVHFTEAHGLRQSHTESICQDELGFLWVGSFVGLERFDGATFIEWSPTQLGGGATPVCGGRGQVLAIHHRRGTLYELPLPDRRPRAVLDTDGEPVTDVRSAAVGPEGTVWWIAEGALVARSHNAERRWDHTDFEGDVPRLVSADEASQALVSAGSKVWNVALEGSTRRVATLESPSYYTRRTTDGAVWASTIGQIDVGEWTLFPSLFRVSDEEPPRRIERVQDLVRGLDIASDGRIVVCGTETLLVSPDGKLQVLGRMGEGGENLCTDTLVDDDGGIWQTAFDGLHYLPHPSVQHVGVVDGLPLHPRFVIGDRYGIVVSTWYGLSRIVPLDKGYEVTDLHIPSVHAPCADGTGTAWAYVQGARHAVVTLTESGKQPIVPVRNAYGACSKAPDGSMLWSADGQLFRSSQSGSAAPRPLPKAVGLAPVIAEGPDGTQWAASTGVLCTKPQGPASWHCEAPPFVADPVDLAVLPGGTLVAATVGEGVWWRTSGGEWRSSLDELPGCHTAQSMQASPRGGVWAGMAGCAVRFAPDDTGHLVVAEQIGTRQGGFRGGARSIHETRNGDLWLVSLLGVTRIPVHVRDQPAIRPRVYLERVVTAEGRAAANGEWLSYSQANVEIAVATPTYRGRDQLRYRLKLRPEAPWQVATGPIVRLRDLRPGRYAVTVGASVDGIEWGALNEPVRFVVLAPWYRRPFMIGIWMVLGFSVALLTGWIRSRHLSRLLEQRQAIARDLHDELGSGLGSIGLIASGMKEDGSETIADLAKELGFAVSDVIAVLRPGAQNLPALVRVLVERGEAVFAGSRTRFRTRFVRPLPHYRLTALARREVQRIAIEAIYNAARHAQATTVVLSVQVNNRRVALSVTDDGVGFDQTHTQDTDGLGLPSMAARAARIGATLTIQTVLGTGTRIEIQFPVRGGTI